MSAVHFALHIGLAAFVVSAGLLFLALAALAYRKPVAAEFGVNDTD